MLRSSKRRVGAVREVELHRVILEFAPLWRVVRVGLDVRGQQVVVRAGAGPGLLACQEIGTTAPLTVVGLGASGTPSLTVGFGRGRPLRFFGVAMTEIPFALSSNSRRGRRLTIVGTEGWRPIPRAPGASKAGYKVLYAVAEAR